ncbi:MAG: Holliday junction resolvase Hjc [archaeon]
MMKNKIKGSNAERELLLIMYNEGCAASRVAGSGSSKLPTPDIIATRDGKTIGIECKSTSSDYLNIKTEQIEELNEWIRRAGVCLYIAWRLKKDAWAFFKIENLKKTKKAYSISRIEAENFLRKEGILQF